MPEVAAMIPDAAALKRLMGKLLAPTRLKTAEFSELPDAIRARVFVSMQVADATVLQTLRDGIAGQLASGKLSRQEFIRQMTERLGLSQHAGGGLEDLSSSRRLELIHSHQTQEAFSYGAWKGGHDADLLDEYPAQELIRVESREVPRDWTQRWVAAGGRLYAGRMVARKDDLVWTKISRFGHPWPPFDFGSGMGVEDIDRDEAESLGVIAKGDAIQPPSVGYNAHLKESLDQLDPEVRSRVESALESASSIRL